MKHALTENDVKNASPYVLAKILCDLGLTRIKGTSETEVKHGLLLKHLGEEVELNQGGKMKPGTRVKQHFTLLDWLGRAVDGKDVEGVYIGVWNGYAHVKYRTVDLPRRFQTADVMEEFTIIGHDFEPGPEDVLPD